jgi:hypothetical protein
MRPESLGDVPRRGHASWLLVFLAVCVAFLSGVASPAAAQMQMVMGPAEHLPFDRPESWALGYFTSATLLSGLETPRTRRPGDVSIGLEFGWLPRLDSAQIRVGYNGVETQDLNKAPFIPRPRMTVGLPARLSLIVAGTPPVRMFGIKAALLAVGLERPLVETPRWVVGLRGYGQIGTARASYTCPQSSLVFAPGEPGNEDGCQAPSSDIATLRYAGGEVSVAYVSARSSRFSPHAAVGVAYMDVGFQVDALTFGFIDHTRYLSHGVTVSGSGGLTSRLTSRLSLGVDVFYTPLRVRRGAGAPVQNDGLFNIRALMTYRLR